jgi:hypothetical protein
MNSGAHVNRWKLVEHIFHAALEFPLSDRSAYLARACGDDAELRSEVASLLENNRDDTATIHRAVDGDLKRLAETTDRGEIAERVGPYPRETSLSMALGGGAPKLDWSSGTFIVSRRQCPELQSARRIAASPHLQKRAPENSRESTYCRRR